MQGIEKDFLIAVTRGDLQSVKHLIARDCPVNAQTEVCVCGEHILKYNYN